MFFSMNSFGIKQSINLICHKKKEPSLYNLFQMIVKMKFYTVKKWRRWLKITLLELKCPQIDQPINQPKLKIHLKYKIEK